MLQIVVQLTPEGWDEEKQEFVEPKTQTLQLEYSLVSISKWESKWCKPFLVNKGLTHEETLDYIKCMTITQNVKDEVYLCLTDKNIEEINDYISAPMTATTVKDKKTGKSKKQIPTSELIYSWMVNLNIPFECQKWHLNRLIMLIRVLNAENDSSTKMSNSEIMARNKAINTARKKQLNTRG